MSWAIGVATSGTIGAFADVYGSANHDDREIKEDSRYDW